MENKDEIESLRELVDQISKKHKMAFSDTCLMLILYNVNCIHYHFDMTLEKQ